MATNISTFRGTGLTHLLGPDELDRYIREVLTHAGYGVVGVSVDGSTAIVSFSIRITTHCDGRNKNEMAANIREHLLYRYAFTGLSVPLFNTVRVYFDRADRECPTAQEGVGGGYTAPNPNNGGGGNNGGYIYNAGNLGTVTVSASDSGESPGIFEDLSTWFANHQMEAVFGLLAVVLLLRR